ncbi:hypothetical protein BDP55DRAFT_647704 [Colletotrichum godetiae]|uniref:Secreted protein n=1 Tax=Colletotrichum godetiae TaxID=1209918 RepID=A0AAJ0AXL0_9PEZI|nr:uncharacterized protein BDP55DRAFT_647704 [Colletotrichum godetiae]KAK1691673.1 hypothetical protein BDP55DRAFT_647704 [Colletotrichum godetiae]
MHWNMEHGGHVFFCYALRLLLVLCTSTRGRAAKRRLAHSHMWPHQYIALHTPLKAEPEPREYIPFYTCKTYAHV